MKKRFICFIFLLLAQSANSVIVNDAKILNLYVQSKNGSSAHAVRVDKDLDDVCQSRMYVEFEDKELFSTLLAYEMSGKKFSLMYHIEEAGKHVWGHLHSRCRLFSVY